MFLLDGGVLLLLREGGEGWGAVDVGVVHGVLVGEQEGVGGLGFRGEGGGEQGVEDVAVLC